MNTRVIFETGMPAAATRLATPAPQSTRYKESFTVIATDGPNLSGSGLGFPVPNNMILLFIFNSLGKY